VESLGVGIRGRSYTLRINYRTSHQIRSHADRLLSPEPADVDGNSETRRGAILVFRLRVPRRPLLTGAAPSGGWRRRHLGVTIEAYVSHQDGGSVAGEKSGRSPCRLCGGETGVSRKSSATSLPECFCREKTV